MYCWCGSFGASITLKDTVVKDKWDGSIPFIERSHGSTSVHSLYIEASRGARRALKRWRDGMPGGYFFLCGRLGEEKSDRGHYCHIVKVSGCLI